MSLTNSHRGRPGACIVLVFLAVDMSNSVIASGWHRIGEGRIRWPRIFARTVRANDFAALGLVLEDELSCVSNHFGILCPGKCFRWMWSLGTWVGRDGTPNKNRLH